MTHAVPLDATTSDPFSGPPPRARDTSAKVRTWPHKLGLHVLRATPDLPTFIAARPAVVRFSGAWDLAATVPSGTLVVGQGPYSQHDFDWQDCQNRKPQQAAEQFVTAQYATYRAHKAIPYWEGPGEIQWTQPEQMHWFAEFEIERMLLMHTLGLKCVIGNFAAGNPELSLWDAFLPAVEAGLHHAALLGLREISWPWNWWATGKYQMLPGEDAGEEGWSTLRYRQVYQQILLPKGLQIPLVITECTIAPEANLATSAEGQHPTYGILDSRSDYSRQLAWYETELSKDPYVLGMAISNWGHSSSTSDDRGMTKSPRVKAFDQHAMDYHSPVIGDQLLVSKPADNDYIPPRVPYRRTYILLPQFQDTVTRTEWRIAAAVGSTMNLRTLGHSADDAGVGPEERNVLAINPETWDANLRDWYAENYAGAELRTIETSSPWEMGVRLMPPLEEDIALAQIDPRWADYNFGESPLDSESIGEYGCFLTGLAIILRKHLQRDVTPPLLDRILVAARAAYVHDNLLMWQQTIPLFPMFDQSIKDNVQRTAAQLQDLLNDGWEVILRRADGAHFVYLEKVVGETLHIIDTWDGKRKRKSVTDFRGIRAARLRRGDLPKPTIDGTDLSSLPPRESYHRTYVLLPQAEDPLEQLPWRIAAAIGSADRLLTIGHSADDAGVGPQSREIIAINAATWGKDLKAWYDEHYPAANYRAIETESPWEMAVQIMPQLEDDIALAQKDPRWARYDFGTEPDSPASQETIGRYGCFLTGFAIILRKTYGKDVTPPLLDKILVAAGTGYVNDNFMAWETAIPLFPAFDGQLKDNRYRSSRELKRLLEEGWEIILRRADGAHFVYLERVEGNALHIIDTWDGQRKTHLPSAYRGIRAAHVKA